MKKETRQLKINREIRSVKEQFRSRTKTIPSLKIAGEWFRAAGFEIGQSVDVQVKKGKLVLTIQEE